MEAEEEGAPHDSGCGFDTPEPGTACFFPTVTHAEPTIAKILLSLAVVGDRVHHRHRLQRGVLRAPRQASRRTHRALPGSCVAASSS